MALVWGGFEFGEPPEAVLAKLPQSRQSGNTVETGLQSFGAEFDVVFEFDQYGLSAVRLNFIRCLSTTFGRLVNNVVHQITLNSGIGERRHKFDNETRKRWIDGDVIVHMLAVDYTNFPVLSIEFSKSKILDVQLWAYKKRPASE